MKRRNLFLSLICSIILTITLVTFTVIGILPNAGKDGNKGQNAGNVNNPGAEEVVIPVDINKDADGTAEKPYYLYSAETFDTLIREHGAEGAYFELYTDIDFAGVDFVPYFNQDVAFNGHIIGNGKSLKNISIEVSKDNFDAFIYEDETDRVFDAHIGVFGTMEDAEIDDVIFDGLTIAVADDVYSTYVPSGGFATEKGFAMRELTVGSVASIATNTTFNKVVVNSVVDAGAYAVYVDNYAAGYNAVGAVVAVSDGSTFDGLVVKATVIADSGKNYFIGGVAGYAYDTTVKASKINLAVTNHYEQVLYIGGVAGFAKTASIEGVEVTLSVDEINVNDRYVTGINKAIDESKTTWVAGVFAVVRANAVAEASTITDVKVVADVDIDAIYAGAIVEVRSTVANLKTVLVTVKDLIVDAKINVLKAYGAFKVSNYISVEMTKTEVDALNEAVFNIRMIGSVILESKPEESAVASLFASQTLNMTFVGGFDSIKVIASKNIIDNLSGVEGIRDWAVYAVVVK